MFEILSPTIARIGKVEFHSLPSCKVIDKRYVSPRYSDCGTCGSSSDIVYRGVQLAFPNGFALSVMWGTGNYCEARDDANVIASADAEVALMQNGTVIGDVVGWVSPQQVLDMIPVVMALPADVEYFPDFATNRFVGPMVALNAAT